MILCPADLPEVRNGVRQGALSGNVGWHPGVVLNLKGGRRSHKSKGQRSPSDRVTAFFHEASLYLLLSVSVLVHYWELVRRCD